MREYRLSKLARLDMMDIADYTVDTWGPEQAYRYVAGLEDCFRRIATAPEAARACEAVQRGYRRVEHEKHVVFYRVDGDSVLIGRILHQRMLPGGHLIEAAE